MQNRVIEETEIRALSRSPLVSVCLINYNQENDILEALETIAKQTYQNVELVIADDHSTDQSLRLIKKWIEDNKARFVRAEVITVEQSTGISGNYNRAVRSAKGEYIKILTSENRLFSDYLSKMVAAIGECDIAFCYACLFTLEEDLQKPVSELKCVPEGLMPFFLPPESMYRKQLIRDDFIAPTALLHRRVYEKTGLYDERYTMLVNSPFWLRCVKLNLSMIFVSFPGVYYSCSAYEASIGMCNPAKEILTESRLQGLVDAKMFLKERKREMLRLSMWKQYLSVSHQEKQLARLNHKFHKKNLMLLEKQVDSLWKIDAEIKKACNIFTEKDVLVKKDNHAYFAAKQKSVRSQYQEDAFVQLALWDKKIKNRAVAREAKGQPALLYKAALFFSPVQIHMRWFLRRYPNILWGKDIHAQDVYLPAEIHAIWKRQVNFSEMMRMSLPIQNNPICNLNWRELWKKEKALEKQYAKGLIHNPKLVVVFVVQRLCLLSSTESIYTSMQDDSRFTPVFLISPYAQPGIEDSFHYDEDLLSYLYKKEYYYLIGYEHDQWKSLLALHPDAVFFQTPYAAQRPPIYSYQQRIAFPSIYYTPYGPWVMARSITELMQDGLNPDFFDVCQHAFLDKLSLDILHFAAPQYDAKSILSGSPKMDFYKQSEYPMKYCWKQEKSTIRKRILWMPRWGIAQKHSSFLEYVGYFQVLIARGNVEFVLRPHPLLWGDIRSNKIMEESELQALIDTFALPENANIDETYDYREGILSTDILVMDFSSIIYEALPSGVPIVYTKKEAALLDERIMSACYVVEGLEALDSTMSMLLRGEDPLKQCRVETVETLQCFPHGTPNGEYIKEFVAEALLSKKAVHGQERRSDG